MDGLIQCRLGLPLQSKPRPRCTRLGRAYNPPAYAEWKHQARDLLVAHWVEFELPTLEAFELDLQLYGPGRSDPDNLAGAFLDAGLPDKKTGWRGGWRDDRVTVCKALAIRWHKSKQQHWDATFRF